MRPFNLQATGQSMTDDNHPEYPLIKRYRYLNPKLEFAIHSDDLIEIEKVLHDKTIPLIDGLQPLHLAIFFDKVSIVEFLLITKNISVETTVERVFFEMYYREIKWRGEFGNKITLLTFAVLYNRVELASKLLWLGADPTIKSQDNRTLLMCAVDYHFLEIVRILVPRLSKADINHRDNLGLTAVHCLFKQNLCKCHSSLVTSEKNLGYERLELLKALVDGGADINMLVNGSPESLLINIAAYRHECQMIEYLLPRQEDISLARPLYYATLPSYVNHPLNYFCRGSRDEVLLFIQDEKSGYLTIEGQSDNFTVRFIVENINLRKLLGFPVHPKEIDLIRRIDRLYLNRDNHFTPRSAIFHRKSELLKNEVLEYDNKKITVYEVMTKCDLTNVVMNQRFLEAFERFYRCVMNQYQSGYFEKVIVMMIKTRVNQALHSVLIDECQNILFEKETLFSYIPLKCTLKIISYLNNSDVKKFVSIYGSKNNQRFSNIVKD